MPTPRKHPRKMFSTLRKIDLEHKKSRNKKTHSHQHPKKEPKIVACSAPSII